METNITAFAGLALILALPALISLWWRRRGHQIEKLGIRYDKDGHRRAAERDQAWYDGALAASAHRK